MKRFIMVISIAIILTIGFTSYTLLTKKETGVVASGIHPAKYVKEKYQEKIKEVDKKYDKYTPSEAPPGADMSYWKSIEQHTKNYELEQKEAAQYYKDLLEPFQDELINEYASKDNDRPVRVTIT